MKLTRHSVNGNFTVNIGQFTSYQALDWLQKGKSIVRALHPPSSSPHPLDCYLKLFLADCYNRSEQHINKSIRLRIQAPHSEHVRLAKCTPAASRRRPLQPPVVTCDRLSSRKLALVPNHACGNRNARCSGQLWTTAPLPAT